jgi:hypothetical protein
MGRKSARSSDPFTDLWNSHLEDRFHRRAKRAAASRYRSGRVAPGGLGEFSTADPDFGATSQPLAAGRSGERSGRRQEGEAQGRSAEEAEDQTPHLSWQAVARSHLKKALTSCDLIPTNKTGKSAHW